MVYSENLLNLTGLMKCDYYLTKKTYYMFCILIAYTKTRAIIRVLRGQFYRNL